MGVIEKALAQTGGNWNIFNSITFPENMTANNLLTWIINMVLWVAGFVAILYLIYSGILYLTAAGNPDAAKKGQQGVVNAIIGIIIIVLAYVIAGAAARLFATT